MFYDIFVQLCERENKKPGTVAREIGFDNSLITHWRKRGFAPKDELKQKIADYFNVTVDYLLGNQDIKKEPSVLDDPKNEIIDKIITKLCSLSDDNQKKVLDYIELLSLKESQ